MNPFARATYDLGDKSALQVAVSAGSQPVELIAGSTDQNQNLNGDLAALGQMQRISRRDNQAACRSGARIVEAAYQTVRGSRTYRATVYAEEVSDAAFLMSGDSGFAGFGQPAAGYVFAWNYLRCGRLSPHGLFRCP